MTKPQVSNAQKPKKPIQKEANITARSEKITVLLKGKATKLSPKAEGHIGFQIIKDSQGGVAIQLTDNTSGGIFSKNPIPLKQIVTLLGKQTPEKPFKSSLVKDVFSGKGSKSANNTSFLIAVLRSKELELISPSDKSQFLSVLSPEFKAQSKKLLSL
ncbi:MAG TPA: hypothetical protein VIM93_00235 [Kangiella sp.]